MILRIIYRHDRSWEEASHQLPSKPRSARWLLGSFTVVVLVLAVVARMASHGDTARSLVGEGEWSRFDVVPLSPRAYPLISWTGREAVIFGGAAVPADGNVSRTLNDGAVYDPIKDAWRPMTEPPFDPPLAGPKGTWTGSELLVVGAPCKDQPADEATQENCTPGGLKAGAFDPVKNTWREVELPASVEDDAHKRSIQAIGSSADRSVFILNGQYWLRSANGAWSELQAPPIKARSLCLVGDQLVAVDYADDASYQEQLSAQENSQGRIVLGNPAPPEQKSAMVAARLDLPDGRWKTVTRTGAQGAAAHYLNSTCAPDGAYLYSADSTGDAPTSFTHYDARAEAWEAIAPPLGRPGVNPPATFVNGRLVVWGDAVLQYERTDNRWTSLTEEAVPDAVVPAGDRALLYYFRSGDDGAIQYRSFKP